jgi:hypothetical protein
MLDHSFTLQAVMELQRSVGALGTKIDHLSEGISKQGQRLERVEKLLDRVWTGAIVGGAILSLVAVIFWWAVGDRITVAVRNALVTQGAAPIDAKP